MCLIFKVLAVSIALASFAGFSQESKKLEIIATIFPSYDFARIIGGDKANVSLILPPGVESHSFEPSPRDIVRINKADIFIFTGKHMEPWAEGIIKGVKNEKLLVLDASKGIKLINEHEEDHHDDADDHGHHHSGVDPHIWLDFGNCQIMVDSIASALAAKDPSNKDYYLKNAESLKRSLADLDASFKKSLATAKRREIIYGGHFAFAYLAKRYGLEHESPYDGFSPNAEPSPKAIAQLIKKMRESGNKHIYYEELIDPKVARTIAAESGAKMELLHGAHNVSSDEMKSGASFLGIMRENLKKLEKGLECQTE